jgi:hypothetical protein
VLLNVCDLPHAWQAIAEGQLVFGTMQPWYCGRFKPVVELRVAPKYGLHYLIETNAWDSKNNSESYVKHSWF